MKTYKLRTTRSFSFRPRGWWIAGYRGQRFGWGIFHEPRALFIDAGRFSVTILKPGAGQ